MEFYRSGSRWALANEKDALTMDVVGGEIYPFLDHHQLFDAEKHDADEVDYCPDCPYLRDRPCAFMGTMKISDEDLLGLDPENEEAVQAVLIKNWNLYVQPSRMMRLVRWVQHPFKRLRS